MHITEILSAIQSQLKAPKNQFNKFGNYKYRSCEDILEGLKPLLAEHKAAVTIQDDIQVIGNRVYVKATATLMHSGAELSVTAFAREAEDKKGMDAAQVTGATSSYARKYALNGLFACDDTKDSDHDSQHKGGNGNGRKPAPAPKPVAPTEDQQKAAVSAEIWKLCQAQGMEKDDMLNNMSLHLSREITGSADLSLADAKSFLEVLKNAA